MIIVAICVIALIVIAEKRKELEKGTTCKKDSDKASVRTDCAEKAQEGEGPQQVTIYKYHSSNEKCLCTLCDAENDASAIYCQVCGQQLS